MPVTLHIASSTPAVHIRVWQVVGTFTLSDLHLEEEAKPSEDWHILITLVLGLAQLETEKKRLFVSHYMIQSMSEHLLM